MKRLSKVILIAFVAVLVLAVVAVFALRAYVQGDGGRARVEEAVGKALKIPVTIGKVTVDFPGTVRVEGIASAETDVAGQPKITARELRGTFALRPLLSGDIEISDVALEQPVFEWPQTAEGRWAWPSPEKKKATDKTSEPKKDASPKTASAKASVLVHGIKILHGTVDMKNAKGETVIAASDVETDFSEVNERRMIGAVKAAKLVWGGRYVFENVRTKLRYVDESLTLEDFDSASFSGTIRGRYEMDTKSDGQPFKTRIELRSVDLGALSIAAGWEEGELAGRLAGEVDVTGRTDRIERLEGPGRISIEGGRFKRLEVFESIAQFLQLGELANFQPREVTSEFKLRDEKVFIDSLVFATENLRISAQGMARFDGKLALDARLAVPERLIQTIPDFARGSFTKQDDGMRGLDFKISGKTNKPKTDLAERLMGGKVQDKVADLLGSLFGSKPNKKDDKKKDGDKDKAAPKQDEPNQ